MHVYMHVSCHNFHTLWQHVKCYAGLLTMMMSVRWAFASRSRSGIRKSCRMR